MFVQSRVVYIVKNFAGQPSKIISDIISAGVFQYFFDDLNIISNRNFLKFISSLPKNTVFCINTNYNPAAREISKKANIAIPFISSHVSFPVKLGEIVWFYKYEVEDSKKSVVETYEIDGYYLGRVHSLLNTEDSAYCFHDREITQFSNDKKSTNNSSKPSGGILEALEHNENTIPLTADLIEEPSIDIVTDISKNILNSEYFYTELVNYKLNPANTSASKVEDVVLRGSHNTLFELSSCKPNSDFNATGGKINIIAGNNEKLRLESFLSERSLSGRTLDQTMSSDTIDVKLFKNGVEAIVDNSLFYETIKTTNQFVNPDLISSDIRSGIVHNLENNITNNSASLIVSQYGFEDVSLKNSVRFSIPYVFDILGEKEDARGIKTYMPFFESISELSENSSSSIIGLSDSITFKLHEENTGAISLITPGKTDGYQNYIVLKNDNVHINANKIVIGDANRQKDQANGYNASLLLGFGDDMQSLVLGEQLNEFLKEIIGIQKTSIDLIKDLFKNSKENDAYIKETLDNILKALNGTNTGLAPLGANAGLAAEIPGIQASVGKIDVEKYAKNIENFKANKEEDLYKRLSNISDSLELVLSKFVKSSWDIYKAYNYILLLKTRNT